MRKLVFTLLVVVVATTYLNAQSIQGTATPCRGLQTTYSFPNPGGCSFGIFDVKSWIITPEAGVFTTDPEQEDIGITFNNLGTYTITMKYRCGFVDYTLTKTVVVSQPPIAQIESPTTDQVICDGRTALLRFTATAVTGAT